MICLFKHTKEAQKDFVAKDVNEGMNATKEKDSTSSFTV